MNIKQKIGSAFALGTMALSLVAPMSFAATTITIKNNGAFSTNKVKSVSVTSKSVSQSTTTVAKTGISASAKTGNNSSSFNTGGTNTVTSGAATNTVGVAVTGGSNTNTGGDCGCLPAGTTDLTINGNGAFSYNKIVVVDVNSDSVTQGSTTIAKTQIWTNASTGGNSASFNTGGDNTVTSGNATNEVGVTVTGGSNTNN